MTEWKECKIADLGTVIGGATPSTKNAANYEKGTIAWITPKDLSTFTGRYIQRGERNITEIGLKSCSTQLLPTNSVLFSSRAPIGYIAIAANEVCTNQGFKSVIPNDDTDPLFLYYLLKYNKDKIESMGSGTTFKEISGNMMKSISVRVPKDVSVQKRISAVLGMIDDKIEENERINDNLQQQAFSVFDNLIANDENNDYTVSDYAFLNPKRTLAKNQVARSIDMSQLSTSEAFPSGWEMKPFNGGMRFTNGDTLLARITPCLENGKTAFIDFLDDGEVAFGSTEYIVLAPKNDTPPEMLYCLARYPTFVDYAVKNMNGSSGRQRVSAETVGQYRLPLFDKHSLVLFKEVVSPMFLKMRYNSLENMRLAELRDALLPKLMSGEIDVSAVEL